MNELKPLPISSNDLRAQLAMELAVQLLDLPEILKRFGLSADQLKALMHDQGFRSMVKQFKIDWAAADNVTERVRLKAGVALEDSLPELYSLAHDPDTAPAARIDAIKQLASLADAVPRKDSGEAASKFSVTINLPSGEPVKIEAPAIEGDFEDD